MKKTNKSGNWLLLWILFIGYTIVYTDKTFVGISLVPIAKDLNLTPEIKGTIMSAFFLGYAIMQIPAGILNDKFGSKKILIAAQIGLGILAVLFGYAWSLVALIAIRFCAGVVHAGYPVSCSKTVATIFPVEKRTFPQSILLASSGLGGVIASLGGAMLIKSMGYKFSYIALGLCAVVVAVLIRIFAPNKNNTEVKTIEKTDNTTKVSFIEVLKNPVVIILIFAEMGVNMDLYGLTNWLPSYFVAEKGLDLIAAGRIQSIMMLGGGVAAVLTGYLVGKYMQGKEKRVVITASVIAAICLWLIYNVSSITSATILLLIGYTCLMASFVTMFSLPLKRLPENVIGVAIGACNTGGVLGGFLAPIIVGNLVGASGTFGSTFIFFSLTALVSGILLIFMKNDKHKEIVK